MNLNPEGDPDAGFALLALLVVAVTLILAFSLGGRHERSRDVTPAERDTPTSSTEVTR